MTSAIVSRTEADVAAPPLIFLHCHAARAARGIRI